VPDPEQLVVQLDGAEHPLIAREALGETPGQHGVVVLAGPRLTGPHGVLERVMDQRDQAQVGA
jgi:hypothetical protein